MANTLPPKPVKSFLFLFAVLAALQLTSNFFIEAYPYFHYLAKPAIMVSLSIFFWIKMRGNYDTAAYLMQAALFFSLLGDSFLMFEGDQFFMLGLGAFLISQLGYAVVFGKQGGGLIRRKPWWAFPFVGYGLFLLLLVWDGLGDLQIPVIVYASAIMAMVIAAANRTGNVVQKSFSWVMIGALAFMVSDSLIAINKFTYDVPQSASWIMSTYILAQYLIVQGYLFSRETSSPPSETA